MFSVESLIKQHMDSQEATVFVEADISEFIDKCVTNSFLISIEGLNDDLSRSCFSFCMFNVHYITLVTDDVVAVIYQLIQSAET